MPGVHDAAAARTPTPAGATGCGIRDRMPPSDADSITALSPRARRGPLVTADASRALRNAGWLVAQRILHVAGATLFAVLVPRLLGPAVFGRYALLVSVSLWFSLLSGLGAVSMLTRSIPRFLAAGDEHGLRRLASSLVLLRALTGACSAAGYFLVATLLLGEPDLAAAALVAGAVLCRSVGNLGYSLLLGLNDAARWGMGELARRWLALALVPAGFLLGGLRGACVGLLASEALVLGLGIWWVRPYLGRAFLDVSRQHLAPFLRLGSLFGAGNLLLTLTQRSGETLVRFSSGSYEEIGYFGAAYAIYLTLAHALWQVVVSLAPHLVAQVAAGRRDTVARWVERLLAYAVSASVLCLAAAVFLGRDLIPLLLGREYSAVAANLLPMMGTLVVAGAAAVGRLLALALDRPRPVITAAALELAVFLALGIPLAMRAGSLGASVATFPAAVVFAWFLTWRLRPELPFALAPARRALLAAAVFVPLVVLRDGWRLNAALFAGGACVYLLVLVRARVIAVTELDELRRVLAGPPVEPAPEP
jgi:O-antigen/teichoic acid export membrane protein